jgi:hypothetical protein
LPASQRQRENKVSSAFSLPAGRRGRLCGEISILDKHDVLYIERITWKNDNIIAFFVKPFLGLELFFTAVIQRQEEMLKLRKVNELI